MDDNENEREREMSSTQIEALMKLSSCVLLEQSKFLEFTVKFRVN